MKQRGKKKKESKEMRTTSGTSGDNVKRPNIRIIGVPEEEDRKKGHEKILEEIRVENFPKIEKEMAPKSEKPIGSQGKTPQDTY